MLLRAARCTVRALPRALRGRQRLVFYTLPLPQRRQHVTFALAFFRAAQEPITNSSTYWLTGQTSRAMPLRLPSCRFAGA